MSIKIAMGLAEAISKEATKCRTVDEFEAIVKKKGMIHIIRIKTYHPFKTCKYLDF